MRDHEQGWAPKLDGPATRTATSRPRAADDSSPAKTAAKKTARKPAAKKPAAKRTAAKKS